MRERGMTLLEIMVAVFIVAIMMSFLLTIYIGTMRVRRRTEEVTEMNARERAAFDLIRRDLQGAFALADQLPVENPVTGLTVAYGGFDRDHEFRWEAPVGGNPTNGFRRVSFVTAMDGSRSTVKVDDGTGTGTYVDIDPLRLYEHAAVSWSVRGGALFRQTCAVEMSVRSSDAPANWVFNPPGVAGNEDGVQVGADAYQDMGAPFTAIDTYRGMPYIMTANSDATSGTVPSTNMYFEMDNGGNWEPVPVNVVVCFPASRDPDTLPRWTRKFRRLETGGVPRTVSAGGGAYRLYSKPCPDARVHLGPNEGSGGDMYFVILEPLWWSLGEDAEDLVFRPSLAPSGPNAEGVYTSPVPEYADVTLVISDPGHPTGRRVFGERIWIPAGGGM